jgi:hypothetical protein
LRPAQANILQDTSFQITRAKWTGDVVQVTESLLCKHAALSSNPRPIKTKTQKTPNVTVMTVHQIEHALSIQE